jgi:hypothetical protein
MQQSPDTIMASSLNRGGGAAALFLMLVSLLVMSSTSVGAVVSGSKEGGRVHTDPTQAAYAKPFKTRYPFNKCKDAISGMSGLCLLVSKTPKVKTQFFLRNAKKPASVQAVMSNRFQRLIPGDYLLTTEGDLDQNHELAITISPGALSIVQTAVVKFNSPGKYYRIQHYQDVDGINGRGCSAIVMDRGARALLPGNYQVNRVAEKSQDQTQCLNGGTTLNFLAGQGLSVNSRKVLKQTIPETNRFKHPNGVSALASISQFGADIEQLGVLPKWRSFNGINNPHVSAFNALVLTGIGTHKFLVPFEYRPKRRECGISLAQAGLSSHVLMTNCTFQGAILTGFRVNRGNYYIVNNRHGKTAIEANFINNAIQVSGVNFHF